MLLLTPLIWALLGQVPPTSLTGIVTDSSGKPMVGAEVWLADLPMWDGTKLLGQARTDAKCRFSIPRPASARGEGSFRPLALWAYAPGHRLGLTTFPADLPAAGDLIRIEVGPPAQAIIRLVPPDGSSPIKGKVEVFAVLRRSSQLPRSLIERLAAPIGADGVATLDGFTPEDIQGIDARTEAFGTQTQEDYQPFAGDRTIQLRPVGHLSGKVVADDLSQVKRWKVTATTRPDDEPGDSGTVGNYWTDTDDQGRFDFPTLPTGHLTLRAEPPSGIAYRTIQLTGNNVVAGKTLKVDIPVQRGVCVEGFVREVGTGAPMPNVCISLFPEEHFVSGHAERTDANGRYSEILWPGKVTMHASGGPPTHLFPPNTTGRSFEIPPGVERFTVPTIEMSRGQSIRGVVLDNQGRPVADAAVEGQYQEANDGDMTGSRAMTQSDRSGAFVLEGLTPGAAIKLSANKGGDSTAQPVTTRAGAESPITLTLAKSHAIALSGKILDPDGRPLVGALVLLKSKTKGTGPPSWSETPVRLEGVETIRTQADGVFETPRELAPNLLYRAEVVASGMARAQTGWVEPPSTTFPPLMVRRTRVLRSVAGQVVDRAGEPVVGAVVFQSGDGPRPTRSVTDSGGRFRLEGILDGRAFLFATHANFRFLAQPIGPSICPVEIILTRDLEQPASSKPPAVRISRAEEKTLARDQLAIARPSLRTGSDDRGDQARLRTLEARLDPNRVIELIQNQVVAAEGLLADVALGLIEDEPQEALDLIESCLSDGVASASELAVFDALDPSEASLRRQVLVRAERRAQAIQGLDSPWMQDQRHSRLAQVAGRWLDLGDRDRGASVLREARAAFKAIPNQNQSPPSHGELVQVMARIDLPAALAIVDRDPNLRANNRGHYDNIMREIAVRAAEVDPAEAERLFGLIGPENGKNEAIRRACYRMAPRDLARARRLASGLGDPGLPPLLDVLAARALLTTDPRMARSRLDSAFEEFGKLANEPTGRSVRSEIATLMAMCLPVVARLDPSLVPEFLARCLAARPNRADEPDRESLPMAAFLAMFLARYDLAAAEVVFERVPEGLAAPTSNPHILQANAIQSIIQATATFDPRAALAILDRIPDDPKELVDPRWDERKKQEARLALVRSLTHPVARRRIEAAQSAYWTWPIE